MGLEFVQRLGGICKDKGLRGFLGWGEFRLKGIIGLCCVGEDGWFLKGDLESEDLGWEGFF